MNKLTKTILIATCLICSTGCSTSEERYEAGADKVIFERLGITPNLDTVYKFIDEKNTC